MIDFNTFPKTEKTTYTIIKRTRAKKLQIALELEHVTDYQIRTCGTKNPYVLKDIDEHLPAWFDARYAVLISHFDSMYLLNHMDKIEYDEDVENALKKEEQEVHEDYVRNLHSRSFHPIITS